MKFAGFKLFHKNQAGYTIVELLVALAITGFISLGATVSSIQLISQTSRDTNYVTASRQATNAIHWISRDALMAQAINGYDGFPQTESLSFTWRAWDNTVYTVSYALENGTLKRTYSDGTDITTTIISEHINSGADMTCCSYEDGVLTLTVTGTTGDGDRMIDVTKTREITNRTDL